MTESTAEAPTSTPEDQWRNSGVRVIPSDSLDGNTAQTPGTYLPGFYGFITNTV